MKENKFEFTYKAPTESERRTIEAIKSQYEEKPRTEGAYEKLIRLDKKVKNVPTIVALIVGILGTLIFGLGLTMVLEWHIYVWGVLVSLVGAVPVALAPILHTQLLKRGKKKHAKEILILSEQILKNQK